MGVLAIGFAIPVLPFVWAGAYWALLPFVGMAFAGLWFAFKTNNRHGELREHISLWHNLLAIERHEINGEVKRWQANPYWLRIRLVEDGGPVENYLTLIGSDREIEVGAFLSPEERAQLKDELEKHIKRLDINA